MEISDERIGLRFIESEGRHPVLKPGPNGFRILEEMIEPKFLHLGALSVECGRRISQILEERPRTPLNSVQSMTPLTIQFGNQKPAGFDLFFLQVQPALHFKRNL